MSWYQICAEFVSLSLMCLLLFTGQIVLWISDVHENSNKNKKEYLYNMKYK